MIVFFFDSYRPQVTARVGDEDYFVAVVIIVYARIDQPQGMCRVFQSLCNSSPERHAEFSWIQAHARRMVSGVLTRIPSHLLSSRMPSPESSPARMPNVALIVVSADQRIPPPAPIPMSRLLPLGLLHP